MSLIHILLFFCINLFIYTSSFNLFSKHGDTCNCIPVSNSSNKSNTANLKNARNEILITYQNKEIENHLPSNICYGAQSLYNEFTINNFANYKDGRTGQFLGLLCLNCATCLAVAEILELHATNILQDYFNKYSNEEIDTKEIGHTFKNICNTAFKNYDLRQYDGHIFVGQCSITSTHIRTPYDGQWTKKLRETCKNFLSHMDLKEIVFRRKWGNLSFVSYICRFGSDKFVIHQNRLYVWEFECFSGDGIFRDCKNFRVYPEAISKEPNKHIVDCNSISGKSDC